MSSLDDQIWLGRVFGRASVGGNHTAVVRYPFEGARDELAARLHVPDTAFVVARSPGLLTLRTFSPVEELMACIQTTLASVVAEQTPLEEPFMVAHVGSAPIEVVRQKLGDGHLVWARQQVHAPQPTSVATELSPRPNCGWLTGGPRRRLVYELASDRAVDEIDLPAEQVMHLCRDRDVNGIAYFAATGSQVRARVFTTSLHGREDIGTGGVAIGIGQALHTAGVRGELSLIQGPVDSRDQGYMTLRLEDAVLALGAEVTPLLTGSLLS